jgi:predicted Zn-dependent protease
VCSSDLPDQPVASINLAVLFYELNREAEGMTQIERNIRLGIEPAISYGVLGQFRERQGDLAAAQGAYEKSLSLDPENPVARQLLANLKARLHATKK